MSQVDIARLKRIRSAITSTLNIVPEKSSMGLPATYSNLREQVIEALPEGLKSEAEKIAPPVALSEGRGAQDIIGAARAGHSAHAHLAALKGWLDAVIDTE